MSKAASSIASAISSRPCPPLPLSPRPTNKRLFRQHGYLIGSELRLLGFNVAFAPVLDLRTALSSDVMRTRVVSEDPKAVIAYAEAFLTGLSKAGALGCGKHFPGLGGGALDSHHATPAIDRTWKQLWEEDLLPFRKLHRALPFIMVSHATYPQAYSKPDTKPLPASISPFWIERTLKHKLAFRGLVISDDMEMGGILHHAPMEEAAVAAIAAGAHLIEICKDPALVLTAYEAILSEAERSRSFRTIVEESAATVRAHRHKLLRHAAPVCVRPIPPLSPPCAPPCSPSRTRSLRKPSRHSREP